MKTFIRRPGNKTNHLKHIIPRIPEFKGRYIEPFLGTGAVYLNLLPKEAILNDLNTDIANIWKLVKSGPEYLINEINKFKTKFLKLSNADKLKVCKGIVSKMDTYPSKKRTAMYLIMVYCSFNGCLILSDKWYIGGLYAQIYLTNKCHIFTENYKTKLLDLKKILKKTEIYNKDYTQVLKKSKKGDFVFLDPPYVEEKNYAFNYNKDEDFDPVKLKQHLKLLDNKGVKWMMTQIDTHQVRNLFKGYKLFSYENSSMPVGNCSSKKELIITNY